MEFSSLQHAANLYIDEIVALRRDLHQHPELSGHEERTASLVAARLRQAGLHVKTGVGGHGVVALLGSGEPCVALRADMDALPVQEETGLPWASVNPGLAHACGHDFHTAWLVGAALILQEVGLPRGSVKFIFQPAEEAISGAAAMIAAGVLENPSVAAICGAHVWPELTVGEIALRAGPNLAAADRFSILIHGAGTHGAHPHQGRDPIPAAAELILALQTLVSRRLNPLESAVVSVCRVAAGSAFNIIPASAELEGTVRTLRPEDQEMIEEAMGQLARHIARAHGCEATLHYERGVPATITDPQMTALAESVLRDVLAPDAVKPREQLSMGAEDFAFFLQRCPGTLLWVGCAPEEASDVKPLHHPGFVADEGCLKPAMLALAAIALAYLAQI